MDTLIESTRKTSIAILGTQSISQFPNLPQISNPTADNVQGIDFFLISTGNAKEALEKEVKFLFEQRILRSQIIFIQESAEPSSHVSERSSGVFALTKEETSEEIRIRFAQFLDQQKHRLLWEFWESAPGNAATGELIEKIHFAHSIALALNLSVQEHWQALVFSSRNGADPAAVWQSHHPLPFIVAEMAALVLQNLQNPFQLREELRVRSAHIPFRQRTEFRSAVEKCMELLWKGSNAA